MKGLFSYDNPFMQALMYVADLIILNVLFILCSLPLFTIGAAQSGLFNAVRVMQDKEDDSSLTAAFFRGFKNGFKRITIVWLSFLAIFAVLFYNFVTVYILGSTGLEAPTVFAIIGLCLCGLLYCVMTVFHSRFDCTVKQLFRNALLLILAHPLRCIALTLLIWSPLLILLLDFYGFTMLAPVFLAVWFSVTSLFAYSCMKKPFTGLAEDFQKKQAESQQTEQQSEQEVLPEGVFTEEALQAATRKKEALQDNSGNEEAAQEDVPVR